MPDWGSSLSSETATGSLSKNRTGALLTLLVVALAVLGIAIDARDHSIELKAGNEPMSAGLPFSVRLHPYAVLDAPDPYAGPLAPIDDGPVDASGVRVAVIDNHLVDHPVAQAQYALALLNGYNLTGDRQRLALARRQADRLLERAVSQDGAIYFPYPFDFDLHEGPDVMLAPWYSAMAQGQALSVFVRLVESGETTYRAAADRTFASFLQPGRTVLVDRDGYYWPEEYPGDPPDRTFNGMVFALYGLVDYQRLTGDADAKLLIQATLTTVNHVLPGIRVPGGISRYCLAHAVQDAGYHAIHIRQLEMLSRLTGDPSFAEWAALLRADHDPNLR